MLPIGYFTWALVVFSRSWDELQRRILLESFLIAGWGVALASFGWGWLSIGAGVPALHAIWILSALLAFRAWRAGCCRGATDERGSAVNNRLKVLRAERDWSQAVLAERLGVSRQTVNAIERGKYDPSLPLAFRIARLFDQPIEAIFQPDEDAR